jgi:hypothetical protein
VIALATGDWHLWDVPPVYRESEPDWWAAMQRPIDQIKAVWRKYHEPPILFGGDLFDRWKASPELINWALKHLPPMYAVAGNHDLPNHRYEDVHKSAYWTMVEAGRLVDLKPGFPHPLNGLTIHGFPYGVPIKSIASHMIDGFNVALIHSYVWRKNHGYTGAPEDRRVSQWERKLSNFSHAFFSDNHSAFDYQGADTLVVNSGCIMRRRRDESGYEPRLWALYDDGEVHGHVLDCSQDCYSERGETSGAKLPEVDAEKLIESLKGLQQKTKIDFQETCRQVMRTMQVGQDVEERVLEALG